jgi:hypothetical protein
MKEEFNLPNNRVLRVQQDECQHDMFSRTI